MTFTLHDYQQRLVDKTRQAYMQGYKAPCVVAPCGAGKSVIISEIARMTTNKGNRVLFLVHRRELIEQIKNTFKKNEVNLDLVQFGMVQTVVRRLDKTPKPALIITDENHHALAKSYRKIYDHFSDVLRLGFTATPIRLNGYGLGDVNDILIEEVDAKWLIENNIATAEEIEAIDAQAKKDVLEGKKAAWNAFVAPIKAEQQELVALLNTIAVSSENKVFIEKYANDLTSLKEPIRKDIITTARKVLRLIMKENDRAQLSAWITAYTEKIQIS